MIHIKQLTNEQLREYLNNVYCLTYLLVYPDNYNRIVEGYTLQSLAYDFDHTNYKNSEEIKLKNAISILEQHDIKVIQLSYK